MIINGKAVDIPHPMPTPGAAIEAKGVKQKDLARLLKTKQPNISRMVKGEKWPVNRHLFNKMVAFLFDPAAKIPPERKRRVKSAA